MPKPAPDDAAAYFERHAPVADVHAQLFPGKPVPRDPGTAARTVAAVAGDREDLARRIRAFPGGALWALDLLVEAGDAGLREDEIARLLAPQLGGEKRGRQALWALRGRGLLGQFASTSGPGAPAFAVWRPFLHPLGEILAGLHLLPAPRGAPEGPDRRSFALAVLLGHLTQARVRVTGAGDLWSRDRTKLEALFGRALGEGGVAELLGVADHLGLASEDESGDWNYRTREIGVDVQAAERFLRRPRGERRALVLGALKAPPNLIARLWFAGGALVPRWLLERAVRLGALRRSGGRVPAEAEAQALARGPLLVLAAWGIVEDHGEGLRLDPGVHHRLARRGTEAPEVPEAPGGRWHVQPNLEVVVPPEAPPADLFGLTRCAELVCFDRAATLRLTAGALAQATAEGLTPAEVRRSLEACATAPLPDTVARAVADAGAAATVGRRYHGEFLVVAPERAHEVAGHPALARLLRAEIAPGVLYFDCEDKDRIDRALAEAGVRARRRTDRAPSRGAIDEVRVEVPAALVGAGADPDLARALDAARRGDEVAFPLKSPRPEWRDAGPVAGILKGRSHADIDELADEMLDLLAEHPDLSAQLLDGIPRELRRYLEPILRPGAPATTTAEDVPFDLRVGLAAMGEKARSVGLFEALGCRDDDEPVDDGELPRAAEREPAPPQSEVYRVDWAAVAEEAIRTQCDIDVRFNDGVRHRITPHRLARRGEEQVLEALFHESGDLRAIPGVRILLAAPGPPSDPDHLPSAGEGRVALRAARNESCPCGSGRKYKRCCLEADLRAGVGA